MLLQLCFFLERAHCSTGHIFEWCKQCEPISCSNDVQVWETTVAFVHRLPPINEASRVQLNLFALKAPLFCATQAYGSPDFDLNGPGNVGTAWIDYDGVTVNAYAAEGVAAVKPATPVLTYKIDIAKVLGTTKAYAGFTGEHALWLYSSLSSSNASL